MRAGRAGALAMGGKKRYEVYQDKPSVELSNKNLGILIPLITKKIMNSSKLQ
jgi:hypothetical protein